MYELINDKTLAEYEAFLQQHPKGHFAQSSLWAKQKPMWAWNAVAVRGEDGKIKGSLALMSRKVPGIGRTLLYGCRGPVCDLRDRETFAELLEGAKALAKQQKAYVIKIDPDVPSSDTAFAEMMRCSASGARRAARILRPLRLPSERRGQDRGRAHGRLPSEMALQHPSGRAQGRDREDLRQGDGPGVRRPDAHDRRARRLRHPPAGVLCEYAR
ncbi:MAG: peptidoglycan bridge formation glycyltransferase FemA/FemB family protein [Oscillospiraceae bacterium]